MENLPFDPTSGVAFVAAFLFVVNIGSIFTIRRLRRELAREQQDMDGVVRAASETLKAAEIAMDATMDKAVFYQRLVTKLLVHDVAKGYSGERFEYPPGLDPTERCLDPTGLDLRDLDPDNASFGEMQDNRRNDGARSDRQK